MNEGQYVHQSTTHIYLGHVISSTGDNNVNIQYRKKKALGGQYEGLIWTSTECMWIVWRASNVCK